MNDHRKYKKKNLRIKSKKVIKQVEVQIEKVVQGAKGMGLLEGKVVFVPQALTGETHLVCITKDKKDFMEGYSKAIIKESPLRIQAPCQYYQNCGGCDFQHVNYLDQLSLKKQMIQDTLKRLGKLPEVEFDIVPSTEWEYRSRARVWGLPNKGFGFKVRESSKVQEVDQCMVLTKPINQMIHETPFKHSKVAEVSIQANEDGFITNFNETINIKVLDKDFHVNTGVFFQSNQLILPELVNWVIGKAPSGNLALDLFSGVGFFAAFLENIFQKVIAVEQNPHCLKLATKNCSDKTEFITEDAVIWAKANADLKVDFLVVDPPRDGLGVEILEMIQTCHPTNWVYVSCNPVTLARDIQRILARGQYEIEEIKGFDFYPQTSHLEMGVSFKKL